MPNDGSSYVDRRKLVCRPAGAGVERGVVADYNAEELADVSEDEKRQEKAKQCAERKAAKWKKTHVKPSTAHRDTHSAQSN